MKALAELQNKRKQEMQARIRAHQELELINYQAMLKEEDEVVIKNDSNAKPQIQGDVVSENRRRGRSEAGAAERFKSQ